MIELEKGQKRSWMGTHEDRQTPRGSTQADIEKDLACYLVMVTEDWERPNVIVGSTVDFDRRTPHVDLQLRRTDDQGWSQ